MLLLRLLQKIELLKDVASAEHMMQDMMLDFSKKVAKLHQPTGGGSRFYRMCTQYVSDHLFTSIKAEQMAHDLGYTRAYLYSRFYQEAGISLIHKT